jgi:hypothetical protein
VTFSLVQPVDQRLRFGSFLLGDVKVPDVLGSVLQLAQLLLKTLHFKIAELES